MPADFANNGDAQQAGWTRTKTTVPGSAAPFMTIYEIQLTQDRQSGHSLRITGQGTSGGAADANALAAVNAWRRARYGSDDTGTSKGPRSGQDLVPDQT